MKENIKHKIIYIKEGVIISWLRDIVTYGCLFGGWYGNHKLLDGGWFIDFTIACLVILVAVARVNRKLKTIDEAIEELKELKNDSQT